MFLNHFYKALERGWLALPTDGREFQTMGAATENAPSPQEGCNHPSGSVCPCHSAALGSIPRARWIGLWRFISRPSTLETVYLSWLAWPHKMAEPSRWLRVGRKEPLRTTSSLAVTTLSVLHIYWQIVYNYSQTWPPSEWWSLASPSEWWCVNVWTLIIIVKRREPWTWALYKICVIVLYSAENGSPDTSAI